MKMTEEQRINEAQRVADLQAVMAIPEGRRLVWRLLGECGTFHSGWSPSAEIHLRAGMRQIGLNLYADIHQHCFDTYQVMEREARDEAAKAAEREQLKRKEET